MFNKEAMERSIEKVPILKSPWNVLLTVLYAAVLAILCALFFSYYGYIRHPLYLALTAATLGLAFLANNWLALGAAALQLIPALAAGWLEDRELIERDGQAHRDYIKKTGALLPRHDVIGFLRLLFLGLFLSEA